jgi:hypothetical protein
VITIDVKRSEIAEFIQENKLVELNGKWSKETEARSLASMLALRKAMRMFPIHNAVSFHSSIEKAVRNKELQQFITESFQYEEIDTFTVSGEMPTTKRNEIVREFADSSKALITNARCLTEGVDVPNIDCIVFADPRKSKVDIVQALGRALRKKEGKDWGYVILPVIYDDTTHEIDNENFNEILAIVRGLASNDERIVEYFKDKNDDKPTKRNDRKDQFQFEVISDYIDAEELSSQLQIKLWEKLSRFNWMPFEEAREFVRSLHCKSISDYKSFYNDNKIPRDIPLYPHYVYINRGWINYGDWFGTNRIADHLRVYRDFSEAKKYVKNLKIKSQTEWKEYCKSGLKPKDIPAHPEGTYKNYWHGWGDWLGTDRIATFQRQYLNFQEARQIARNLELKSQTDWFKFVKKNSIEGIPNKPNETYKTDWISWGDWLGTGKIATSKRQYLNFSMAKEFIKPLRLKTVKEWMLYSKSGKLRSDIPSNPQRTYKTDWISWGDWLGTNTVSSKKRDFLPYEDFKKYIQELGIKNTREWKQFLKSDLKPEFIPTNPETVYKNSGWKGKKELFGTNILDFDDAREYINKLKIKGELKAYLEYWKINSKPSFLPLRPDKHYKNFGWKGWADFLGNE